MNLRSNESTAGTGQVEKRMPHSIRFLKLEWERIEAFAGDRGLSPAEFVRFAALAAIQEPTGALPARLAPLIEETYRFCYILATKRREEMFKAGERELLDALIAAARKSQARALGEESA